MKKIIHLSDLHFRQNWEEEQGLVLEAFFKDLSKQIEPFDRSDIYLAFSGDVVLAGGKPELYESFLVQFNTELNKLKIPKSQRICIPGNHDVSVNCISEKFIEHEGVLKQCLNEHQFNDYISKTPIIFVEKFSNYKNFELKFAKYGMADYILSGTGWNIEENIGIFCLNTAVCSSGGINEVDDKERLAIDTRNLQKWISNCKAKTKILIMHHPINWLTEWAQIEIKKMVRNNFSLCLSGHSHDQDIFYSINKDHSLIECSAPPLLTNKKDNLGYSVITVSDKGVDEIQYRQWTKNNFFVTGVNFSNTDNGKVIINKEKAITIDKVKYKIEDILTKRLDDALRSFSSQPIIWVDPVLCKTNEISRNIEDDADKIVDADELISNTESTIVKAPPQFGLTCLAHYLVKQAWNTDSSLWLYLDSHSIKSSHRLDKALKKELTFLDVELKQIKCIILDSWTNIEKDSFRILKKLSESHINIPIIVMQTIDDAQFFRESNYETINREFNVLHLLALPRGQIRKVVSAYNEEKHIGDEDAVITKVVSDLEVLNIHRTPLNCLTLLKVSEKYFDESPVNRTKLLEMVLFVLFNMDGIPTYKARPDLKDCEYVLGRFCEKMIRTNTFLFSREDFLKEITTYCTEKLIELEIDMVFDVLHSNNIIVNRGINYGFRFTYWIYYFAAHRMYQNQDFASYILKEQRYAIFPQIIEFYTGIDRRRDDALRILMKDIKFTCDIVEEKVGLPDNMNPYRLAEWKSTEEAIEQMKKDIGDNVLNSNLPDSVKDQYADREYDRINPYDQDIHSIFKEYSLLILSQTIKAASRALRNSDYADPEIKREMLKEIVRSWEQMLKVTLALTPMLALQGFANYDGASFILLGDFGDSIEKRIDSVLDSLPKNIVQWYKDDLFSHKMGPLLFDLLSTEESELKKHLLVLLQIYERPRDWRKQIENYIASISKNSFYLADLVNTLCTQYRFSFASSQELKSIAYLIKMGLAKHEFGINKPSRAKIIKIPNTALPKRLVDDDDSKSTQKER